jgi:hypothetical protein
MAPIYGMAEKAAELILSPPTSGTSTSTAGGASGTSGSNNNSDGGGNAAVAVSGAHAKWLALVSVVAGVVFTSL